MFYRPSSVFYITTRLIKKAALLIVDYNNFIENLITLWDLEIDFQGASFEPNRSFICLGDIEWQSQTLQI